MTAPWLQSTSWTTPRNYHSTVPPVSWQPPICVWLHELAYPGYTHRTIQIVGFVLRFQVVGILSSSCFFTAKCYFVVWLWHVLFAIQKILTDTQMPFLSGQSRGTAMSTHVHLTVILLYMYLQVKFGKSSPTHTHTQLLLKLYHPGLERWL